MPEKQPLVPTLQKNYEEWLPILGEQLDDLSKISLESAQLTDIIAIANKNPDVFVGLAQLAVSNFSDVLPLLDKCKDAPQQHLEIKDAKRLLSMLETAWAGRLQTNPTVGEALNMTKMYAIFNTLSVPTQMGDLLKEMAFELKAHPDKTDQYKAIMGGMVNAGLVPAGMVADILENVPGSMNAKAIASFEQELMAKEPDLTTLQDLAEYIESDDSPQGSHPKNILEVTPFNGNDALGILGVGYGGLIALIAGLKSIKAIWNGSYDTLGNQALHVLGGAGIAGLGLGNAIGKRGDGLGSLLTPSGQVKKSKLQALDKYVTHLVYRTKNKKGENLMTSQTYVDAVTGALKELSQKSNRTKHITDFSGEDTRTFTDLVLKRLPDDTDGVRTYIVEQGLKDPKQTEQQLYLTALAYDARKFTSEQIKKFYLAN